MTLSELEQKRTKRLDLVSAAIRSGKSNRAIAKELGVNEATIRNDRKFLDTPLKLRPVKKRPAKKVKPAAAVPVLSPAESRTRRFEDTVKVVCEWMQAEHFLVPDMEFLLNKTGKLLCAILRSIRPAWPSADEPLPHPRSPANLLALTRPAVYFEDDMPAKLESSAAWLTTFLHLCWPYDEQMQDEVLRQASVWAHSPARQLRILDRDARPAR